MSAEKIDAVKIKVIHWQESMSIPGTSWEIRGYSRSSYRTGFYIPALDTMLDAGPQNFNKPTHIFITHSHMDHIACLPLTMIGDSEGNHIFKIHGPDKAEQFIRGYIRSMFSANAEAPVNPDPWYEYQALRQGDFFRFVVNKTELGVEVFKCDHSVTTISYGFTEYKQKLKEEYKDLPGKEIGQRRKAGEVMTEEVGYKRLAFVCDTSIKVFDMNPTILDYKVIFIECTFLYPEELEMATKKKHIHWQQLRPYVKANPDSIFILFHFSQRYRDVEIAEFLGKEVEGGLTNLKWW